MNRAHRGKQWDWSKQFKLIQSKSDFQKLDNDIAELVININTKPQAAPASISKKQQIITPKYETVKRATQPKKFAKMDADYIRITDELNLPKLQSYQLSEVDYVFLQGYSNRFKLNGKVVLTGEFLSKAFIQLQKKAGKDPTLPRSKNWMTNFVQRQYKQLTSMPNYQNFTEIFYNYWKNRRQQLKFPMLRELWHPNPDQYNHLLAFKPRQKQKRNLRKNNRLPQDEISQQMEQQFLLATKIAQRIKYREQLKLKQLQIQMTNFHNQCRQFFPFPSFFNIFDPESRIKDKQKLKKLQNDAQNIKKMNAQDQKQNQVETQAISTYDQKQSIAQFLSTVTVVAQNFGLNYQKLFTDKIIIPKQAPAVIGPVIEQVQPSDQKCDHMSLSLYRNGNTLYRTFKNQQQQTCPDYTSNKTPKNLFEYKSRQLQLYYYGSDDEGDTKDLRKNIATGFKRFQQQKVSSSIDL